jgi:hypothetical protein
VSISFLLTNDKLALRCFHYPSVCRHLPLRRGESLTERPLHIQCICCAWLKRRGWYKSKSTYLVFKISIFSSAFQKKFAISSPSVRQSRTSPSQRENSPTCSVCGSSLAFSGRKVFSVLQFFFCFSEEVWFNSHPLSVRAGHLPHRGRISFVVAFATLGWLLARGFTPSR